MSRGWVIASFLFGGFVLSALGVIATHYQHAAPESAPHILIVPIDTAVKNPFSLRFVTDQPVHNSDMGLMWGDLHPHLLVDSLTLMPSGNELASVNADTFRILVPHLSAKTHTLHLYWADMSHRPVGDTASILVKVIN